MVQPTFVVVPRGNRHLTTGHFVLEIDSWNDFGYHTLFHLSYNEAEAKSIEIGMVKIAKAGMAAKFSSVNGRLARTPVPSEFSQLGPGYFSLGQDREYYENIARLPNSVGAAVLRSLADIAADTDLFPRFENEDVLQTALMRNLSRLTVETQFRRIIAGDAALTPYRFSFTRLADDLQQPPFKIEFGVHPTEFPPTNLHVLIGANGVGKSRLFRDIVATVAQPEATQYGVFRDEMATVADSSSFPFASLLHIAFSAFETDSLQTLIPDSKTDIELVGLTSVNLKTLRSQFEESLHRCRSGPRRTRWHKAMKTLSDADSLLNETNLAAILDSPDTAGAIFESLSSGHKIVLLTMSRLVEAVEERTLVLIDEPETHLHPPLLSALIRAISDLIVGRNAVAIVATHSPVVLQEVPSSCVWLLKRAGGDLRVWQLASESFGESVSRLTSDVFHLEITQTGYHRILMDLLDKNGGAESSTLSDLGGQLGSEGRFVLSALAQRFRDDV